VSYEILFVIFYRKPEYLTRLIARDANPDDFLDRDFTRAVSVRKAISNIRYRWRKNGMEQRDIIKVEVANPQNAPEFFGYDAGEFLDMPPIGGE